MEERQQEEARSVPAPEAGAVTAAAFHEYLRFRRRARAVGGWVSLGAFALLAGTVGICYRTALFNFSEPLIRSAASEEAEQLLPTLREEGIALVREVQPTYVEEAKRALREAMPELQGNVEHEFLDLAGTLSRRTEEALGAAFVSAAETARDELLAAFPTFHDRAYVDAQVATVENRLRQETEAFLAATLRECAPTQEKFAATLARFPRMKEVSDEELQRRFLHYWLLLVDYELTGGASMPPAGATPTVPGRRG
jgi:hypothetical protein